MRMASVNYLVLTRAGFDALGDAELIRDRTRLWLNDAVVSPEEAERCRAAGIEVRILSESVDPRRQGEVAAAIEGIEDEFPEETVMAEYR